MMLFKKHQIMPVRQVQSTTSYVTGNGRVHTKGHLLNNDPITYSPICTSFCLTCHLSRPVLV